MTRSATRSTVSESAWRRLTEAPEHEIRREFSGCRLGAATREARDSLNIALPGGPYRFWGLLDWQQELIRARFGDWLVDWPDEAAVEGGGVGTLVRSGLHPGFESTEVRGVVSTLKRRYLPQSVVLAGLDLLATLFMEGGTVARGVLELADIRRGGAAAEARLLDAFENYLRTVVAYRLLFLGGALFHSSAVVASGQAHLFLGPSGAGKTTVARLGLDDGLTVLSDDINAVLPGNGRACLEVQRLPFAGDLGAVGVEASRATEKAPCLDGGPIPLASVQRLEQSDQVSRRLLSPARALAALLASAPFVNTDPYRAPALADNLAALQSQVHQLAFRRDASFLQLVLQPGLEELPAEVAS